MEYRTLSLVSVLIMALFAQGVTDPGENKATTGFKLWSCTATLWARCKAAGEGPTLPLWWKRPDRQGHNFLQNWVLLRCLQPWVPCPDIRHLCRGKHPQLALGVESTAGSGIWLVPSVLLCTGVVCHGPGLKRLFTARKVAVLSELEVKAPCLVCADLLPN